LPNPIDSLKRLPWGATLRTAAIVVAIAIVLEWAVVLALGSLVQVDSPGFGGLLSPGVLLMLPLLGGAALGVATTELWRRQNNNYLSINITWTLIGSVVMLLTLRWLLDKHFFGALLPPALFSEPSSVLLMGLIIGGFWRSWRDRLF